MYVLKKGRGPRTVIGTLKQVEFGNISKNEQKQ